MFARTNPQSAASQMLDQAAGMESCRITKRITGVRDAITAISDGRIAGELAKRVADVTGIPVAPSVHR